MQRRSKGLLESNYLWAHVKVVTVTISQFRISQVVPPFVQLLGMLPNVHTLEILYVTIDIPSPEAFETYFRGHTFPSIRKVVLPADFGEGGRLVDALIHIGCPNLEVIRGFTIGSEPLKRVSRKEIRQWICFDSWIIQRSISFILLS
ncbi:hypothetical protein OPQ81_010319 [Rhizoctonia solani]|nr:hypothetical protein OPQ81_010319 [Rhizoctonia solani]